MNMVKSLGWILPIYPHCFGSRKFQGVFESVGMSDLVKDGRVVCTEEAVEKVISCFQDRNAIQNKLSDKISLVKSQIMNTFCGWQMGALCRWGMHIADRPIYVRIRFF